MVVILSVVLKILSSNSAVAVDVLSSSGETQKHIGTLMMNMQRIFAETVANVVSDPEIRRLIVLWGLCSLPSISRVVGEYKKSSSSSGFMLM